MTLFFPDLNVWLALSVARHSHRADAWAWMNSLPGDTRFIFSRQTQIGLIRLLSNTATMGEQTLTLGRAWDVYDHWLEDPRVEFYPETRNLEAAFRRVTKPFATQQASKAVGDCFLLAYAVEIGATLVTFDRALHLFAKKQGCSSVIPA